MNTTRSINRTDSNALYDVDGLLAACRAGDAGAWEAIIDRYERLVYAIAIREGLSADDAADVAQVTFEAFIDAMPRLRRSTSLGAWFASVARRQSWRHRERRRHEDAVLRRDAHQVQSGGMVDGPRAPLDDLVVVELHECLVSLGEPCRAILTALYFDPAQPTYAEIASASGRPLGSIGPTRARCLQQLRTRITFPEPF